MGLNYVFDLNRVTNLETRATNVETKSNANETALENKADKTGNEFAGNVTVKGTFNSLVQSSPIANSIWYGLMKDPTTYSFAMGRFHAGLDDIELRAYTDQMIIRTGRSVGAVNANFTIITNDANTPGIPQNIILQPKGILVINPGVNPGNGFNVGLWGNGMPYIQSQNTVISNTSLKFGSGSIQARTADDTAFSAFAGSAFTVGSERAYKTEIEEYNENALEMVKATPIRKYKFIGDEEERERIGLIRDESPNRITTDDKVDLYSMVSLLWKSVQELTKKVEELSL